MTIYCDVCNSDNIDKIKNFGRFHLYKCRKCGLYFIRPKPLSYIIKKNNLLKYESVDSEQAYFKKRDELIRRARKCVATLNKHKKSGKLLDIGCSFGFYLNTFKQYNFKATGIDISKKALQYAKKVFGLNVKIGNFEHLKVKKQTYDVVTLFDLIEHLSYPSKTIAKIRKIMKKRGIIIIQTPNYESLMSRITSSKWFWLLIPQHLYFYTPQSLEYLMKKHNFNILENTTWDDTNEFVDNFLYLYKLRNQGVRKILYKPLFIFLSIIIRVVSPFWCKHRLGGEILLYAQKM